MVYRQVGPGGNPIYFDPNRSPVLYQSLFLPGRDDQDGLSLIRARYRSDIWSAFRPQNPAVRYRLARLIAGDAESIAKTVGIDDLHFDPTPDLLDEQHGEPWAHCVLREINRAIYDTDADAKDRIKEWALMMAKHVAESDVAGPFVAPTAADAYRPNDSEPRPYLGCWMVIALIALGGLLCSWLLVRRR